MLGLVSLYDVYLRVDLLIKCRLSYEGMIDFELGIIDLGIGELSNIWARIANSRCDGRGI